MVSRGSPRTAGECRSRRDAVAQSHSWYIQSDAQGFHYASLATAEYDRRFGHLAYSPGTSAELHLADGRLRADPGALRPLPGNHPIRDLGVMPSRIDAELYALLEPEQRRQWRGMVEAMERVLDGFHYPEAEPGVGPATP